MKGHIFSMSCRISNANRNLAAAVALAVTTSVSAQQHVNGEGTGQVLLFPFYSVVSEANTYIHITNNTDESKAVKIRFLESRNSEVVLEFNAYLGPNDVFPVGIDEYQGGASIITADSTCTVPELGTANGAYSGTQTELFDGSVLRRQPFVPYQYDDEKGSSGIGRTLIGHAEVIEMGVVDDSIDVSKCDEINTLWTSGKWTTDTSDNVTAPTGGLSGDSIFINPSKAFSMSLGATMIDGWAKPATNYHTGTGTLQPTLDKGVSKATIFDGDDYVTVDYSKQANGGALAVSAALATQSINNEVQIEAAIAAETDWVATFPTKRFFVNGTTASAPFTKAYDSTKADPTTCETVTLTRYDRNSNSTTGTGTFVPDSTGVDGELCNSISILSFHQNSALGVTGSTSVAFPYSNGAAKAAMSQTLPADDNGVVVNGLPVIGFAGTRIVNGAMSYGYAQKHKTLTITSGS